MWSLKKVTALRFLREFFLIEKMGALVLILIFWVDFWKDKKEISTEVKKLAEIEKWHKKLKSASISRKVSRLIKSPPKSQKVSPRSKKVTSQIFTNYFFFILAPLYLVLRWRIWLFAIFYPTHPNLHSFSYIIKKYFQSRDLDFLNLQPYHSPIHSLTIKILTFSYTFKKSIKHPLLYRYYHNSKSRSKS